MSRALLNERNTSLPEPKTKPTTESIDASLRAATLLAAKATQAMMHLHAARKLFVNESPKASRVELDAARDELVTLRRTQGAALENIDAALASAKGTP